MYWEPEKGLCVAGFHWTFAQLGCRGIGPIMERTIQSVNGRQWKVIGIG